MYRLNNSVSVLPVTDMSQTETESSFLSNLSMAIITTLFQTCLLTLSQTNSKNYHFILFSALGPTKWIPYESYSVSLSGEFCT